jgi:transposase InsO family protein
LQKPAFPLQPVTVDSPFQQWGLDIIGPINPPSSQQHKYIVIATDYFTRWSEATTLRTVNTSQVIAFLNSHIITRFGIPDCLVFDNASYFSSLEMSNFSLEKGIKLKYSASYYPQGNGLAESTNKNLIKIIKRTVAENHKNWHNALLNALWADRVTPKATVGNSPFFSRLWQRSHFTTSYSSSFAPIIAKSSRRRMSPFRKPYQCSDEVRRSKNPRQT